MPQGHPGLLPVPKIPLEGEAAEQFWRLHDAMRKQYLATVDRCVRA